MATNLAKYVSSLGDTLRVWNRDGAKTAALMAEEANVGRMTPVPSLADLGLQCSIIFTMLSHDTAVREVMTALCSAAAARTRWSGGDAPARPACIMVDCSTVSPDTTRELSAAAEHCGALYVACPVLGRPDAAAAAKLLLFCAGPDAAKQRIAPFVRSLGRKVIDLSGDASKANIMKLLANFHLVSLIELLSEGMTLAEKNGIGRQTYMSFIDEILPVPIVHGYGSRMASDSFDAGLGFTVTLGLKDVNLMRKLGEDSETPLPLADVAYQHLLAAKAAGLADKDWAALAVATRRAAGLDG
ncbi:hypothetical protein HYH03_012987 [Edaphochlamys debaryana]|uniref:6-phosphogluconate dehydrogenase n=1 Tax=Edaphochlamys debaryana TaxID=47281 RepID=A0A835XT25_9CHLO|nr:hypothetical protein HYH03_012987 [Edaphochlamys debaryana]|eukprot:KAG2488483.1 hypothetical protein HYH03_012987 [Edaphochlamys debaryana]